jgi:16S rRNA (guanine527-N7)-methyltransferase
MRLLIPFLEASRLNDFELRQISTYLDLLLKWNSKINLTAIGDREEVITRHFGESLFAARQLFPARDSKTTAIDVGSGPGFPGLPLKLWAPRLVLTLLESNQRKATFLREVVRVLNLTDLSVLTERAEAVSIRGDLVTLRAVEHFERILPVAARLVLPGGRIALLIAAQQVPVAHRTISVAGWADPVLIPNSHSRVLLVGKASL